MTYARLKTFDTHFYIIQGSRGSQAPCLVATFIFFVAFAILNSRIVDYFYISVLPQESAYSL